MSYATGSILIKYIYPFFFLALLVRNVFGADSVSVFWTLVVSWVILSGVTDLVSRSSGR